MTMTIRKWTLCCLLAFASLPMMAQPGQYTLLRFVPKNGSFTATEKDYQPGKKGFYLYENCIYTLLVGKDKQYHARIIGIKKDSIVLATHFNAAVAAKEKSNFDTLTISPAAITTIRLIGDRAIGIFHNVSMDKYRYEFVTDTLPKRMYLDTIQLYTNLPDKYELVPFLTDQGLNLLYEENGLTYYFQGRTAKDTARLAARRPKKDDSVFRRKNIAWVLPTRANVINGLALGLHTGQIYGRQLTINGLNINADVPAVFVSMMSSVMMLMKIPLASISDSADTDWHITNINGLSVSMGGLMRCRNINGLSLNGGMCAGMKARGLFVSGGYNVFTDFKGISIAGLRNIAAKGRGIQIGLLNTCKHFKGLQIGLWNVNDKRKLPFLNWAG